MVLNPVTWCRNEPEEKFSRLTDRCSNTGRAPLPACVLLQTPHSTPQQRMNYNTDFCSLRKELGVCTALRTFKGQQTQPGPVGGAGTHGFTNPTFSITFFLLVAGVRTQGFLPVSSSSFPTWRFTISMETDRQLCASMRMFSRKVYQGSSCTWAAPFRAEVHG